MIANKEELLKHLKETGFYDGVDKCYAKYYFANNDSNNNAVFIQRCPRARGADGSSWAATNKEEVAFHEYMVDFVCPDGIYRTKEMFETIELAIDEWIKNDDYPIYHNKTYTTWNIWEYK